MIEGQSTVAALFMRHYSRGTIHAALFTRHYSRGTIHVTVATSSKAWAGVLFH